MRFERLGKWIDGWDHQMMIETIREKNYVFMVEVEHGVLAFWGTKR